MGPPAASFKPGDANAEDPMSVGIHMTYGKFRTVHLGDIAKQGEFDLVCPNNKLGTVDVLRVPKTDAREVFAGEGAPVTGPVELDQHLADWGDVEYLSPAAVLDSLLAHLVVLVDHRDPVTLAHAVMRAGDGDLPLAELPALCADVLRASVQPSDLLV